MKYYYDTFKTPTGDFSLAVDETGAVAATAFGKADALESYIGKSLTRDPAATRKAREEIQDYFAGKRRNFTVKLAPHGTDFQQSVWDMLNRIPFGKTRTYGELAKELGRPKASRAVGRAVGSNPISLIVPCHRVIGSNGSLTGFAFGTDIKLELLQHEGVELK